MNIINKINSNVDLVIGESVYSDDGLEFACEADMYYHEVFDVAMEAADKLSTASRNNLPDNAFGLVYKDDNDKTQRKYPLVVDHDKKLEKICQQKAIAFFHFVAPEYKKKLATAIVDAIATTKSGVKIGPKNQIHVYTKVPDELIGIEKNFKDNKKPQ